MGKIEENKREKKRKLFDAALELFTSKGFHDTSISNIVRKAGLAKGTFYLYFKDKYDLRDHLIAVQSSYLFQKADDALKRTKITIFEDKIIFIIDHVLESLSQNPKMTTFISKNLSWGIFKSALIHSDTDQTLDFYSVYERMIEDSPHEFKNPEILLFMLIELVGSTCHSIILYEEPISLSEYKPYLYQCVRQIIHSQMLE